jgi:excisionase family DNA binding protein
MKMPIETPSLPPAINLKPDTSALARPAAWPPQPPRLAFSVRETAQMLGMSEKTVRRLIDRKLLRASRALRHLRIAKTEIERFMEETSL